MNLQNICWKFYHFKPKSSKRNATIVVCFIDNFLLFISTKDHKFVNYHFLLKWVEEWKFFKFTKLWTIKFCFKKWLCCTNMVFRKRYMSGQEHGFKDYIVVLSYLIGTESPQMRLHVLLHKWTLHVSNCPPLKRHWKDSCPQERWSHSYTEVKTWPKLFSTTHDQQTNTPWGIMKYSWCMWILLNYNTISWVYM